MRTFLAYTIAHPGKKLLFMGQEFAQVKEWDYGQQLDWVLDSFDTHRNTREFVKSLNKFYLANSTLWEIDYSWEGFEWIANDDYQQSVIAFLRRDKSGKELIAVCNFCPVQRENYRIGVPQSGSYKEVFSTENKSFGGSGVTNGTVKADAKYPMHGKEQSVSLTLPALSVIFLEKTKSAPRKSTAKKAETAAAADDKKPKATRKKSK